MYVFGAASALRLALPTFTTLLSLVSCAISVVSVSLAADCRSSLLISNTTRSPPINSKQRTTATTMFLSRSLSTRSTRSCYQALPSTDSVVDQSLPLVQPEENIQQRPAPRARPERPAMQRPSGGLRRTSSLRKGAQQIKRGSSYFAECTNPFALHSVVEETDLRVAGGWW